MHFWHNRVWPPAGRSLYPYSVYMYMYVRAKRERERKREGEGERKRDRWDWQWVSAPRVWRRCNVCCVFAVGARHRHHLTLAISMKREQAALYLLRIFIPRNKCYASGIIWPFCDYFSASRIALVTHFFRCVRKLCSIVHILLLSIKGGVLATWRLKLSLILYLNWDSKNWKSQLDYRGAAENEKLRIYTYEFIHMRLACFTA